MILRTEEPRDYEVVYHVIKNAFETAEERDGNEQDLVVSLRSSDAFIPNLSIVAEVDGIVVGHILFTELTLVGNDGLNVDEIIHEANLLALAPLSVLPAYQQQGIGTALIEEGLAVHVKWGMTTQWCLEVQPIIRVLVIFLLTSWEFCLVLKCRAKILWLANYMMELCVFRA